MKLENDKAGIRRFKVGLGQDSHRFLANGVSKPCIMGGVVIEDTPGFEANSDGDVIFHAICNAITSLTHVKILGGIADQLCQDEGITDSLVYLEEALKLMDSFTINHLSISIEAKRPKLGPYNLAIRERVAQVMGLDISQVGITATSGEALNAVGCGEGVMCTVILSAEENM